MKCPKCSSGDVVTTSKLEFACLHCKYTNSKTKDKELFIRLLKTMKKEAEKAKER